MQHMLENVRTRRDDERGFTLIELMVVVLIIAILIAIAIPTFLGAKSRAQQKAAQSSLRNALTNSKGVYTDLNNYGTAASLVTALTTAEPSLSFTTAASTGPKVVSVDTRTLLGIAGEGVVLTALSADGNCYVVGDGAQGPGTVFLNHGSATCQASGITALPTSVPTTPNATILDQWAQGW